MKGEFFCIDMREMMIAVSGRINGYLRNGVTITITDFTSTLTIAQHITLYLNFIFQALSLWTDSILALIIHH
jgi:hypothetical protein